MLSDAKGVDTAVIFVHGFGGKPTSTWRDFQGLVDEYSPDYPWWSTSDMFFYEYESIHTPIRYNADLLDCFVKTVWNGGWEASTSKTRKYRDLILVGHSEGAVIIRRLILNHFEAIEIDSAKSLAKTSARKPAMKEALNKDFLLASHLRLFAPACRGASFSSLAGFMMSFSTFVAAVAASSVARNELRPESPVLNSLQAGTEQAHAEFPEIPSLYTHPLFGTCDHIVYAESYRGEELLWDVGYSHTGVCKPTYLHKRPLEFVRK